jgi:hypothetical protein
MGDEIRISHSRVSTYRACPQKHAFRYVDHLEPVAKNLLLQRGIWLHELIEKFLTGADWEARLDSITKEFNTMMEMERANLGDDLPNDLAIIMRGYAKTYQNDHLTYPKVELPFSVPLFNDAEWDEQVDYYRSLGIELPYISFVGKIDAVAKDAKHTYIVEHKTVGKVPDFDVRLLDPQTALYAYALPLVSEYKPTAILWDYVRTKAPVVPEPLKKGGLTKRKDIDTDYDTYYQAIMSNGLDPNDYADILSILSAKGNTFYKRLPMPLAGTNFTDMLMDDFRSTALEIAVNGDTNRTKYIGRNCMNCEYKVLCESEVFGLDADFVKARDFRVKKVE